MNSKIKIDEIKTAPWNARKAITPESVKDLAQSIEQVGLVHPISLWESKDGEIYCVAGNRRLAALKYLGLSEVDEREEFWVFKGSEEDARLATLTENLQREDVGVLEEAELVEQLRSLGMTTCQIAEQVGRPESWVSRRKKLLDLDDEWKKRADGMTADALERIAEYPKEVQKKVAKQISFVVSSWREVRSWFERENRDIDSAPFDKAACLACQQRTGQNADLFGAIDDGMYGRCLCAKCYDKKHREYMDDLIDTATKGADEIVRLDYTWKLPSDVSDERTKEHPCAYVIVDRGEVIVKWGESLKEKKAREEAEKKRRAEEDAAKAERMKVIEAITDKLDEKLNVSSGELPDEILDGLREYIRPNAPARVADYIIDAVGEVMTSWKGPGEWADICRMFEFVPRFAELTDEELDKLLSEYPDESEEDEEVEA